MTEQRRCAWIDATAGASGDMLLGALLDAGADLERVRSALAALSDLGAGPIEVRGAQVRRHGMRSTKADVSAAETTVDRTAGEVLRAIEAAALEPRVEAFATAVFRRLAAAEGAVHGEDPADVHLHEVGALDAIGDVVGCAAALDSLGLLEPPARVVVSGVALGSGVAASRHGPIPVPAPAVLELFRGTGAATFAGAAGFEACTPTGAALLTTLAGEWGDLPPMRIETTGVGAGSADPPDRANVLRIVVGTEVARTGAATWRDDELIEVETTVDDADPRLWPEILDALVRAGAADAWLTPVVMRKGRPGHVATALVPASSVDAAARILFSGTPTLGVRMRPVSRRALPRDERIVQVAGCDVRVKRGFLDGEPVTFQAEYADALRVAEHLGRPVRWVIERAVAAAQASVEAPEPEADPPAEVPPGAPADRDEERAAE